jgi:hypothetical protein
LAAGLRVHRHFQRAGGRGNVQLFRKAQMHCCAAFEFNKIALQFGRMQGLHFRVTLLRPGVGGKKVSLQQVACS